MSKQRCWNIHVAWMKNKKENKETKITTTRYFECGSEVDLLNLLEPHFWFFCIGSFQFFFYTRLREVTKDSHSNNLVKVDFKRKKS